jgi:hypothetical protein
MLFGEEGREDSCGRRLPGPPAESEAPWSAKQHPAYILGRTYYLHYLKR